VRVGALFVKQLGGVFKMNARCPAIGMLRAF